MQSILPKAIQAAQQSDLSYCKFLSANDTKSTGAHQAGYLIGKAAWKMFLNKEPRDNLVKIKNLKIKWQDDFETPAIFTYYASKNELRLTGFGKSFPFREEENVGDLFIIAKTDDNYFESFILSHDDDIENFFAALNLTATETNNLIPKQFQQTSEQKLKNCFQSFINSLIIDFPSTSEMSFQARQCYISAHSIEEKYIRLYPDKEILAWLNAEFQLFKLIEENRYSKRIKAPFNNVEDLIEYANTILNRRKSRAGKSLEHHLSFLFETFKLPFSSQAISEEKKRPDFIFPSAEAYLNPKFDSKKLIVLAAKTTCKDRWRQVLNEADRVKTKYLFTLQQGISKNQLGEMYKHNVSLVVPKPYLKDYPREYKEKLLTLDEFIKLPQKYYL